MANISDERLAKIQDRMWMDEELALMSCDLVEARAEIARLRADREQRREEAFAAGVAAAKMSREAGVASGTRLLQERVDAAEANVGRLRLILEPFDRVVRDLKQLGDYAVVIQGVAATVTVRDVRAAAQAFIEIPHVDLTQLLLAKAEEADALIRDWQSKTGNEANSSGDEDEAGFYQGKVEAGIEILNVFMTTTITEQDKQSEPVAWQVRAGEKSIGGLMVDKAQQGWDVIIKSPDAEQRAKQYAEYWQGEYRPLYAGSAAPLVLRHPDCPACKGMTGNYSCAICAPEFMAAGDATPDDVREAGQKWADAQQKDAAFFEANWHSDPRLIHMVGAVVRHRRHTPQSKS